MIKFVLDKLHIIIYLKISFHSNYMTTDIERDFDYENNNIAYDWQCTEEDGGGIKCKNYEICEAVLPKWWFDCKGHYLCTNCHMMFGTWGTRTGKGILNTADNIECPICFKCKKGISYPRCDHMACIECFKKCMYGEETDEPIFPYPDIEDEYYEDPENPKWKQEYPLVEAYEKDCDDWENESKEYDSANRLCPVCGI